MSFDPVNKPSHYAEGRQFETIEVIEDWKLSYRLGNCVKYISRAGRKGDRKQDLEKAAWYLQREIEAIDKPSQYAPPADVQYEDVLEYYFKNTEDLHEGLLDYYGQSIDLDEAWPSGYDSPTPIIKHDDGIKGASGDDFLSLWEETPDYVTGWDQSLGPVEIEPEEVQERLNKKDLDQFADDEIVSTIERRGMVIGFRKDGTSCVLKDGRCE